ncbi:uroporphyrinogen-III synthase [Psychrobacillus psychrodurans]|uniref:uroporphyrinogen-III synthase n=1 Tax=Psychrobacillus psychrodurans TaxID=126157 RepID=UPI0008E69DA6|nr:uroporphyrinogen-III synthase [Psychrobacillus psychrodurans]MCZ8542158.1 uroporphyrinogen-III synthase [Psychrobacillus psychrodurans]SFN17172.1 uroporphyrinogen-III synthase [Psychrobacillus psychrodurans]
MFNNTPLLGENVIFTGIQRSSEASDLVKRYGGSTVIAPMIATKEIVSPRDLDLLQSFNSYDWLIFTSQSSVEAFHSKMVKYQLDASFFTAKIAVVGTKTANAIENLGLSVDFTPSTFSADIFVREFPTVASLTDRCLFVKGNLAKDTITAGLQNVVDEWTIYETVELEENKELIKTLLMSDESCSIIFTSPSTAEFFHRSIGASFGYENITVCAIGHITKKFLESKKVSVQVMPDTYTLSDVIVKLAEWKGRVQ